MTSFILRRVLQMFPTVLGVIIITFILFNIVGGSPAAMTLGKNVDPKVLEDFDEQRGFNKPLFLGRWTATRAWPDSNFKSHAGQWRQSDNATYHSHTLPHIPAHVSLAANTDHVLPLAFALNPNEVFRWRLDCRAQTTSTTVILMAWHGATPETSNVLGALTPGDDWQRHDLIFTNPATPCKLVLHVGNTSLQIADMQLRRANRAWWDSQFCFYLRQLAHLDFGVSSYANQRVSQMLREGILPSLALTVPIFFGSLLLSLFLALVCAFYRDTWLDRGIVIISVMLMSLNYIVWIVFGQYFLAYRAGWFPIWGYESWYYLLLPILIGIFSGLGENVRFYRTIVLDELYRDYVRTAFAKGVSNRGVLYKHVLKNAMIPVLTNVIVAIPFLYAGSLLLEGFFGIPGLGSMSINALNNSDVDVVRAVVFIGAVLYVVANLLTDIAYSLIDPRVKLT